MRPQAVSTLVTTDTGETSLVVGGSVGGSTGTGGQVTGPVAINRRVPSVTTEKLYNSSGTLKWDGSTVPTGSGTSGVLPKFTGAGTLGDSVLTESGGNVSSSGGIGDSVGLLSTVRAGGIGIASQAANDMIYASSATQLARVANGTTGQVWTATTSGAPSWQTLSSTYSLLYSASGTSTDTSNRVIDSYALASQLGQMDTLHVVMTFSTSSGAGCGQPTLYNGTDSVTLGGCAAYNIGTTVADIWMADISASTTTKVGAFHNFTTLGSPISSGAQATFTTAWTGAWTLQLKQVSASAGTLTWAWRIYKVKGT